MYSLAFYNVPNSFDVIDNIFWLSTLNFHLNGIGVFGNIYWYIYHLTLKLLFNQI